MKQGSPTFGAFPEDFGTILCCWTWGHSLSVSSDSLPSGLSPPSCTLSGCWSQEVLVAFARLWKVHVSCYLCSSCSCLWGRLGSFCYSSSLILCRIQEAHPEFSESLDSSCLIQLSLSQGRGENSRKDLKPKDGCFRDSPLTCTSWVALNTPQTLWGCFSSRKRGDSYFFHLF